MLIFFLLPYSLYRYFPISANFLYPLEIVFLFMRNFSYFVPIVDYSNLTFSVLICILEREESD